MHWWQRALLTISGVTGFSVAFTSYNKYYEDRGEVHPITAFIARHISEEEEDRRKRIVDLRMQSELSDLSGDLLRSQGGTLEMTEEAENIDEFLYGDEAEFVQHMVTAEPIVSDGVQEDEVPKAGEQSEEKAAASASAGEDGEEDDDFDLEIVYGATAGSDAIKPGTTPAGTPTEQSVAAQQQKAFVDVHTPGMINGEVIYNVELDSLPEKPWRLPGADITDYFNYGFTEQTWREYCLKQKTLREELGTLKKITVFDAAATFTSGGSAAVRPPVMPPFPFPLPGAAGGIPFPFPPPPFMFPPGMAPPPPPAMPPTTLPTQTTDQQDEARDRDRSSRDRDRRGTRRDGKHSPTRSRSRSRSRDRDSKRRR